MSARKIDAMLSTGNDRWGTQRRLFRSLAESFGLSLDVCAEPWSTCCAKFFSREENALRKSWAGNRYWMNFPYSEAEAFTSYARAQSMKPRTLGVWLSPVRPDTKWWRNNVLSLDGKAGRLLHSTFEPSTGALWLGYEKLITGVRWLGGRQTFRPPPGEPPADPAPFPSAVIVQAHPREKPLLFGTEWTKGWPA